MNKLCFCLSISMFFTGCKLQPFCDSSEAREPWRKSWNSYNSAKLGETAGIKNLFNAAKEQLELPCVNAGEDSEAIREHIYSVLVTIKDEKFHEVLFGESPLIRSAVRKFLLEDDLKSSFPKTYDLLVRSQDVEWPSDRAENASTGSVQ